MSEHSKERKMQEKPEKENCQTMIRAEGQYPPFLGVCSSISSKPFKYANLINVRLIGL